MCKNWTFYVSDVLYPGNLVNGRFVSWTFCNWTFGKWVFCILDVLYPGRQCWRSGSIFFLSVLSRFLIRTLSPKLKSRQGATNRFQELSLELSG